MVRNPPYKKLTLKNDETKTEELNTNRKKKQFPYFSIEAICKYPKVMPFS